MNCDSYCTSGFGSFSTRQRTNKISLILTVSIVRRGLSFSQHFTSDTKYLVAECPWLLLVELVRYPISKGLKSLLQWGGMLCVWCKSLGDTSRTSHFYSKVGHQSGHWATWAHPIIVILLYFYVCLQIPLLTRVCFWPNMKEIWDGRFMSYWRIFQGHQSQYHILGTGVYVCIGYNDDSCQQIYFENFN